MTTCPSRSVSARVCTTTSQGTPRPKSDRYASRARLCGGRSESATITDTDLTAESGSSESGGGEAGGGGGEVNTGANVGSGTGLIFRDKTGVTLNLKSLLQGANVTITNNANDITIAATGEANTGANVGAGTGTIFRDKTGVTINLKTLLAGTGISLANNANDITITATGGGGGTTEVYAQGTDPGATGANTFWFDTTTNILYKRNTANSGWIRVLKADAHFDWTSITPPAAPGAGVVRLYPRQYEGWDYLAFKNSRGFEEILNAPWAIDVMRPIEAIFSGTAPSPSGHYFSTLLGAGATRTNIAADATAGMRTRLDTGVTLNTDAGIFTTAGGTTPAAAFRRDQNFIHKTRFILNQNTNVRFMCGYFDVLPTTADSFANQSYFGIRYTAGVDTNFMLIRNDGGVTPPAAVSTGVAYSATPHSITVLADNAGNRMGYSIDNSAPTWFTTDIPAATTGLTYYCICRVITAGGTAKSFDWITARGITREP